MLNIKESKSGISIKLTRGDSAYFSIVPYMPEEFYPLKEEDSLYLQVRDKPIDGELVFDGNIEVTEENIIWHIAPLDTLLLEIGTYFWDIELRNGEDVFTFLKGRLILTNDITRE